MKKNSVPSPCINICTLNETTNLCKGCLRTPEEIASWLYYSDDEKRAVLAELEIRKQLQA